MKPAAEREEGRANEPALIATIGPGTFAIQERTAPDHGDQATYVRDLGTYAG